MDPLTIAGSVFGLIKAGTSIVSALTSIIDGVKDAPKLAQSLVWEVNDITAALGTLQGYVIHEIAVAPARGSLILLEQVLASLTGCVMTYSDLQAVLDSLSVNADMGAWERMKWLRKESTLQKIWQRLQSHKSSLTLMLTVLQW